MLLYFQLILFRFYQKFEVFLLSHLVWLFGHHLIFAIFQPHYFLFLPPRPLSVKTHSYLISERDKRNHFYILFCVFLDMYSCPHIPLGSLEKDAFEDICFCFYKKPWQRKYIYLTCSNTSFSSSLF